MSDLISRQGALAQIRTRLQDWAAYGNEEYRRGLYACEDMILSLPSAEPNKTMKGSDLISRADAIDAIEELPNAYNGWSDAYDKAYIIGALDEVPSADRPQGEWIDYVGKDLGIEGQWLRDDGKTVFVQCDQCDSMFVRNLMTHMNYCPNCGARMKGAEHEID